MREGLLVLGDHLPDPHSGRKTSHSARHRQIVELAVRAEALGFDSVWLGEHHLCDYILSSPPVVLAAIGERTTRLRLGTGVTLLGNLDPVRAAEDYATLDVLTGGRVEVVAGRGVMRRTYHDFGQDAARSREIYDEHVELLLALWTQEDLHWKGEFRAPLSGVTVRPRPEQCPHPPLWIGGGSSNDSIDLAARLGLRLMLPSVFAPPEAFAPYVERYRERYLAAGHDPSGLSVGACSHVHVARDSQTARARWAPYHMHYIRWVMGDLLPWAGVNLGREGVGPAPIPEFERLIEGPSLCGSPAEVIDRICTARDKLGLDLHLAMFDHGAIPEPALAETLELFAAEVLPHVSHRTDAGSPAPATSDC
jgi:alkanesulfonate monooxygenase SsuD/methylene tetrahydromethanopterin reductase-like flavin-dependent oxidoreductase (luciferase family)